MCTHIYAYGDGGFLEVNMNGVVHTVYTPAQPQPLPVPMSASEVRELLTRFLVWNQQIQVKVGDIKGENGTLTADIIADDGTVTEAFVIDAETGFTQMKSAK